MNWPAEFDGAHTLAGKEQPAPLEAIAQRIEAFAKTQTTYAAEEVALKCAAIVRGEQ